MPFYVPSSDTAADIKMSLFLTVYKSLDVLINPQSQTVPTNCCRKDSKVTKYVLFWDYN